MSSNPWSTAFRKAVAIDAEGEKDFADVPRTMTKKRDRDGDAGSSTIVSSSQIKETNEEDDAEESSGFCQPVKLAMFVKDRTSNGKQLSGNSAEENATKNVAEEEPEPEIQERDMVEVCGRQICRTWLKFAYLDNGTPCPEGKACLRKHAITCKPELLYKDYSFKGLNPKQRKRIMDKLAAELRGST